MQQTETYKFSLIEPDDPFSPEPLNKNMETLDAELARVDTSAVKFHCGTYTGDGTVDRFIALPFTPKAVYIGDGTGQIFTAFGADRSIFGGVALAGKPAVVGTRTLFEIVAGGMKVSHYGNTSGSAASYYVSVNENNNIYRYLAFG